MRLISDPAVYLVTRPNIDWDMVAAFLEDEGLPHVPDSIRAGRDESAAVVEISARLCYMSFGKGRRDIGKFIHNLLSKGDGSVFEHVNYGFVFTGVSRSLTHELVRHRAGFAYSQLSQRFVSESDSPFVLPPALSMASGREGGDADKARELLEEALGKASTAYEDLVSALDKVLSEDLFEQKTDRRKAIRQAARSVLPNATETKIFVTANVRAWRHFIEMRGAAYADWEIRRLALRVLDILKREAPLLFGDFEVAELPDGTRTAASKYPKV